MRKEIDKLTKMDKGGPIYHKIRAIPYVLMVFELLLIYTYFVSEYEIRILIGIIVLGVIIVGLLFLTGKLYRKFASE